MSGAKRSLGDRLVLFAAAGFGSGYVPVAPGTFGTLAGFAWIFLLLLPQNLPVYLLGTTGGLLAAVWIGHQAEKVCAVKDPGWIVLDEIAALPVAFVGAVLGRSAGFTAPSFGEFLDARGLFALLVAFVGFRVMDITKPGLIDRSQHLPNGWGLVADDFLAALAVAPLTYLALRSF